MNVALKQVDRKLFGLLEGYFDLASSGFRGIVDNKRFEVTEESLSEEKIGDTWKAFLERVKKAGKFSEKMSKKQAGYLEDKLKQYFDVSQDPVAMVEFLKQVSAELGIVFRGVKLGSCFSEQEAAFRAIEGVEVMMESQESFLRLEEAAKHLGKEDIFSPLEPSCLLVTAAAMSYAPDIFVGPVENIIKDHKLTEEAAVKLFEASQNPKFSHKAFYPIVMLSNLDFLMDRLLGMVRENTHIELKAEDACLLTLTGGSNPGVGLCYKGVIYPIEFKSLELELLVDDRPVSEHCKAWKYLGDTRQLKSAVDTLLSQIQLTEANWGEFVIIKDPIQRGASVKPKAFEEGGAAALKM